MVSEEKLRIIEKIPETGYLVEKLKDTLRPYSKDVRFAFFFGSYARGEADIWSDVDIGIYFTKDLSDAIRDEIRFKVIEALEPLEVQVGYLDDEDISPEIFIAATEGRLIIMNDEDAYHGSLIKNIHQLEEMKLIGLVKED